MTLATRSVEWWDLIAFYVLTIGSFHLKTLFYAPVILTFNIQCASTDEAVQLC